MHKHQKTIKILLLITLCMFGFTFALIPIYNVFCQVTGLNGKIDPKYSQKSALYKIQDPTVLQRRITVEFDTNRNKTLPCEFSPTHTVLQVIPGELTHTSFHIKN